MRVAEHRRHWSERDRGRSLHAVISFSEDCLELGAGTILAKFPRSGSVSEIGVSKAHDARILALLGAAYRRTLPVTILGNIQRAGREWVRGEKCLGQIHLALSGLSKLEPREEASYRLFMADQLMADGIAPRDILRALELDTAELDSLDKLYDANEPRVPPGSGRPSGEWTVGGVAREVVARARSLLDRSLTVEELGALSRFAARFTNPVVAFATGFIPSPSAPAPVKGVLPGRPDLGFVWHQDEGRLVLSRKVGDRDVPFVEAHSDSDGIYSDHRGRPLARVLDGHLIVDIRAATIDELSFAGDEPNSDSDRDEPKLCPAPKPDKKGRNGDEKNPAYQKDLDYEDQIKRMVNPDHPTPRGFGVQLPNPLKAGKLVFYDDCQRQTTIMFDYKGTGYAKLLASGYDFIVRNVEAGWVDQATRQIDASGGRPVVWVFAEAAAESAARQLFDKDEKLARIETIWIPTQETQK